VIHALKSFTVAALGAAMEGALEDPGEGATLDGGEQATLNAASTTTVIRPTPLPDMTWPIDDSDAARSDCVFHVCNRVARAQGGHDQTVM